MLPAIPEMVGALSETLTKTANRGWLPPSKLEIKGASEKIGEGTSGVERTTINVTVEWKSEPPAPAKNSTSWFIRVIKFGSRGATWLLREVPREVFRAVLRQQIAGDNDPDAPVG